MDRSQKKSSRILGVNSRGFSLLRGFGVVRGTF